MVLTQTIELVAQRFPCHLFYDDNFACLILFLVYFFFRFFCPACGVFNCSVCVWKEQSVELVAPCCPCHRFGLLFVCECVWLRDSKESVCVCFDSSFCVLSVHPHFLCLFLWGNVSMSHVVCLSVFHIIFLFSFSSYFSPMSCVVCVCVCVLCGCTKEKKSG